MASYRGYSIQTKQPLTNRYSVVSESWELRFGVSHEKAKWMPGFHARCLFGRLARAMANDNKHDFKILKSSIMVRISLVLTFSNGYNFKPPMALEVKLAEMRRPWCSLLVHKAAVCLKMRSKTLPTCFFDYRSGQIYTANHENMNFKNE